MIKSQLFIAAALLVGVAIGYFVKTDEAVDPVAPAVEASRKRGLIADVDRAHQIKALESRIAELEAALASAKSAPATNAETSAKAEPRPRPQGRLDFFSRIEEMKKSNPAQYVQMTNRMAAFRRQMQSRRQSRQEFFASLDTSQMSVEAKQSLSEMQEALDLRAEMDEIDFEHLSNEERRETMQKIWDAERNIRELNGKVRNDLLFEVVRQSGFEGDDAADFVSAIKEVLIMTENGRGPGGGPRGPGGPGRPNGQGVRPGPPAR